MPLVSNLVVFFTRSGTYQNQTPPSMIILASCMILLPWEPICNIPLTEKFLEVPVFVTKLNGTDSTRN